ncbi:MAG: FtsQ-type POTRA domain-containing protein [Victivallaceae bacterium]|nr:FtsQ-type POTRA domain-containing protein [Victivallaceae bacterium]
MAETEKTNTRGTSSGSSARRGKSPTTSRRTWKLFLLLLLFVIVLGAFFLFLKMGYRVLFSQNERFKLHRIELIGSGYWQSRPTELANAIGLKLGSDNLFGLSVSELRARLDALPNVKHGSVTRIPPDTLRIQLVERIPRARLFSPRSEWVADADGVALRRSQTMDFAGTLPLIIGLNVQNVKSGQILPGTFQAMKLIMAVLRNYPDLTINAVNVQSKAQLLFTARYLTNPEQFTVILPAKCTDINVKLNALQAAIQESRHRGERQGVYDLTFQDQVIAR